MIDEKLVEWVNKKVDEELNRSSTLFKRALKKIPKEYHDFLISLKSPIKIMSKKLDEVPYALKNKGVYSIDKGTFLMFTMPYFDASGRVQMARDEHTKNSKAIYIKTAVNVSAAPERINLGHEVLIPPYSAVAVVESELKGIAYGTAGIPHGGDQLDVKQWDIEKAETSAIARALLLMGYGIIGTAFSEEDESEKKDTEYKEKVHEFKELQKKKKISDADLAKLAKEIGITKIATVEDINALIKLMNKLPDPKSEKITPLGKLPEVKIEKKELPPEPESDPSEPEGLEGLA